MVVMKPHVQKRKDKKEKKEQVLELIKPFAQARACLQVNKQINVLIKQYTKRFTGSRQINNCS